MIARPNSIEQIGPSKLIKHLQSLELYGEMPTEGLEESIKQHGIFTPLILAADKKTIISGVRRRNAAIKAGIKTVPCIVRADLNDDLDVREAVILCNRHQDRTNEIKAREFKVLEEIEAARAQVRMKTGKTDPKVNLPEGQARDIAAEKVGMSGRTAEKAAEVVDAIDQAKEAGHTEKAEELTAALNKSVAAAHRKVAKKKRRRRPKEVTPAKVVDQLQRKHVSPLVRGIDDVAKINGGKGQQHKDADAGLNKLIVALKNMRKGQR